MLRTLAAVSLSIPLFAINYPSPPQEPAVAGPQVDAPQKASGAKKKTGKTVSVPVMNLRLRIHLGDKSVLVAEVQLPESYSFTHTKGNLQYNQTIRAESIREVAIENYHGRKIAAAKDGDVFEFDPHQVRIELKDGQVYKLKYLFKELRKIKAQNSDGTFTVYAFFADTYKPRTGWLERGGDELMTSTKRAHPAAFVKLEYFEPVERAGAAEEASSGKK